MRMPMRKMTKSPSIWAAKRPGVMGMRAPRRSLRSVPQGLKPPKSYAAVGTAEAVPLSKTSIRLSAAAADEADFSGE